jgi:acetolactate synthase-1/3 small subunit
MTQQIECPKDVKIDTTENFINKDKVSRELVLIKINVDSPYTRREVIDFTSIFRGNVVDVSPNSVIIEITGALDKINAFINLMQTYGILGVARTGMATLTRDRYPHKYKKIHRSL